MKEEKMKIEMVKGILAEYLQDFGYSALFSEERECKCDIPEILECGCLGQIFECQPTI